MNITIHHIKINAISQVGSLNVGQTLLSQNKAYEQSNRIVANKGQAKKIKAKRKESGAKRCDGETNEKKTLKD
jgi:hypothetical protein